MDYDKKVQEICDLALKILDKSHLRFRPMRRTASVNTKRSFVVGRTNLRTGLITIDTRTPRKREEKKISSILSVLCHEVAHHQKMPYRQRYRGRWIIRQHYPEFYQQVTKNIDFLKNDTIIGKYFDTKKIGEKKGDSVVKKKAKISVLSTILANFR